MTKNTLGGGTGYILDISPFEALLGSWLSIMNYSTLGDLYIPTAISVVDQRTGFTHRLWSDNPKHAKLDLLEVRLSHARSLAAVWC